MPQDLTDDKSTLVQVMACTQLIRDVVTKKRRLSLAGRKPKISPEARDDAT